MDEKRFAELVRNRHRTRLNMDALAQMNQPNDPVAREKLTLRYEMARLEWEVADQQFQEFKTQVLQNAEGT